MFYIYRYQNAIRYKAYFNVFVNNFVGKIYMILHRRGLRKHLTQFLFRCFWHFQKGFRNNLTYRTDFIVINDILIAKNVEKANQTVICHMLRVCFLLRM